MAVILSEDWTGSNGAAWNGTRWSNGRNVVEPDSTTFDLQTNRGRQLQSAGGPYASCILSSVTLGTDFEITVSFAWPLATGTRSAEVFYRAASNLTSGYPFNAYLFTANPSGLFLERVATGPNWTEIASTSMSLTGTGRRWIKIRVEGTRHRAKVWSDGAGEPGGWDLDVTDGTFSGTRMLLSAYMALNESVHWDDLTVDDAPGGSGSQSITMPHIASTAALYAPTVAPQPITVTLPFIASTEALYPPTVIPPAQAISLPHIASTAALYEPAVSPGAANVELPHIDSVSTLYAPTVTTGPIDVSLPYVDSTATLYPPTSQGDAPSQDAELPHIDSTTVLYPPSVSTGAVTLGLPYIDSISELYAPTVSQGDAPPQSLGLPHVASTAVLYAPTVTVGAVDVSLPAIASTSALYPPTIVGPAQTLGLPHIASTSTLYAPVVSTAGVTLLLPHIASASLLHAPAVTAGPVALVLAHIASTSTLYPPLVHEGEIAPTFTGGRLTTSRADEVRYTARVDQQRTTEAIR